MARTSKLKTAREDAATKLREWLKPGDTIYTIVEHVSRSGMQREIRVLIPRVSEDGHAYFLHPNFAAAALLGCRQGKRDGLVVSGCGMDMGFHLVYNIGRSLWPDGYECSGDKCQSNDHSNGDRDYTPHHHTDGGYALRHEWL